MDTVIVEMVIVKGYVTARLLFFVVDCRQGLVRGAEDEDNHMSAARKVTRKKKDDDEGTRKIGKRTYSCSSALFGTLLTTARFQWSTSLRLVSEKPAANPQAPDLVSGEGEGTANRA